MYFSESMCLIGLYIIRGRQPAGNWFGWTCRASANDTLGICKMKSPRWACSSIEPVQAMQRLPAPCGGRAPHRHAASLFQRTGDVSPVQASTRVRRPYFTGGNCGQDITLNDGFELGRQRLRREITELLDPSLHESFKFERRTGRLLAPYWSAVELLDSLALSSSAEHNVHRYKSISAGLTFAY